MKIARTLSHLGGAEWLQVHAPSCVAEIEDALLLIRQDTLWSSLREYLLNGDWSRADECFYLKSVRSAVSGCTHSVGLQFVKSAGDLGSFNLTYYRAGEIEVGLEVLRQKAFNREASLLITHRSEPNCPLVLLAVGL